MIKSIVYPIANRMLLQPWGRLSRGITLGVRCAVFDGEGRVLLIQQSYTRGWMFPGGGVERGETPLEAMERELMEEARVRLTEPASLVGLYNNDAHFPGDYVALYVAHGHVSEPFTKSLEIRERGFFAPGEISADTPASVRRRLAEIAGEEPVSGVW